MLNPFTGRPYSTESLQLRLEVAKYPCSDPLVLAQLDKLYEENDVIIVRAGTGAGKGVVVARYMMEKLNIINDTLQSVSKVIVAEPRTENTNVANYLRKIIDAPVVEQGYKFNMNLKEDTRLAFVTYGILLNFFYNNPNLPSYDMVILDEVHERDINMDILLTYCNHFFLPYPEKKRKVVLLSATMDPQAYVKYFSKWRCGVLDVEGVTFPIEHIYLDTQDNYVKQALEFVKTLEEKPSTELKDVIVFMPTQSDLKKGCRAVEEFNRAGNAWRCYELSRATPQEIREELATTDGFKSKQIYGRTPTRKIIFSTNIAESGVTIAGLGWVIESGRRLQNVFNDSEEMNELVQTFITQSEAMQRCGRTGRKGVGKCVHLYSEQDWKTKFNLYKQPEIASIEISGEYLKLLYNLNKITFTDTKAAKGVSESEAKVVEFLKRMPTPPSDKQIAFAQRWLHSLDLIDTELGKTVTSIHALEAPHAITLLCSIIAGVFDDVCAILAMYSIDALEEFFINDRVVAKWKTKHNGKYNEIWAAKKMLFSRSEDLQKAKLEKAKKQYDKLRRDVRSYQIPSAMRAEFQKLGNLTVEGCFEYGFKLNKATQTDQRGMYKIDRPVGQVRISPTELMPELSKKLIFMDCTKKSGQYLFRGLINL